MQSKLYIFRGRPGTGKSTVSNAFSRHRHLAYLRKDAIYDVCAKYIEDHTVRNKISYDSLYSVLDSNAGNGSSFVIDYPFQNNDEILDFTNWAKARNYQVRSMLVICSDEKLWNKRLAERTENPAPNQILTNLEDFRKRYGDLTIHPLSGEIVIDTVEPVEQLISRLGAI